MAVERSLRGGEQVERLERGRWLLEVHADGRHIVLNRDVVPRRMRLRVRTANDVTRVPLHVPVGPACGDSGEGLAGADGAVNCRTMRARVGFSRRRRLHVGCKQQTRRKNSQRGRNLADHR